MWLLCSTGESLGRKDVHYEPIKEKSIKDSWCRGQCPTETVCVPGCISFHYKRKVASRADISTTTVNGHWDATCLPLKTETNLDVWRDLNLQQWHFETENKVSPKSVIRWTLTVVPHFCITSLQSPVVAGVQSSACVGSKGDVRDVLTLPHVTVETHSELAHLLPLRVLCSWVGLDPLVAGIPTWSF